MPQRDLLLPWLSAVDNAALALRIAHVPRAQAREQATAAIRRAGARRIRAGSSRMSSPAGCASGSRSCARCCRASSCCAWTSRSARWTRSRVREMHAWLVEALAREPRTVVLVTHDVEEAVVLADRVAVLSPDPAGSSHELEVGLERPRARTDPEVVALREQALAALGREQRRGRESGQGQRRTGAVAMKRRASESLPASCSSLVLLGAWELYVDLGEREYARAAGAPSKLPRRCGTTPACSPQTCDRPPRRWCSGSRWRWRAGFALAIAIHLSPCCAAPSTRWPSAPRRCRSR